jgi:hypothetical protein
MQINNIDGLTTAQIRNEVSQGGKFVFFKYTISIVVMTFQRTSDIYYIQPGASAFSHSWGFLLMNLFLGWWGIPWGPIYTIGGIYNNLTGGTDVTAEIMSQMNQSDTSYGTGTNYNIPGYDGNTPTEGNTGGYNVPNPNSTSAPANPTYNIPNNGATDGGNTYNIPRN